MIDDLFHTVANMNSHRPIMVHPTWNETLAPEVQNISHQNPRLSLLAIFAPLVRPLPPIEIVTPHGFEDKQNLRFESIEREPSWANRSGNDSEKPSLGWMKRVTSLPWANQSSLRLDIRNLCIGGVVLCWFLSISAIAWSTFIMDHQQALPSFIAKKMIQRNLIGMCMVRGTWEKSHLVFAASGPGSFFALLLLNVIVTGLLETHARIHSTTLRWSRYREKKPLRYNTLSGFFNTTKSFGPCHWSVNIINGLAMCVAYGATAATVSSVEITAACNDEGQPLLGQIFDGPQNGLDVSGFPLLTLGVSLLVQSIVSTWKLLYYPKQEKSWSSDPVVNAKIWAIYSSVEGPDQTSFESGCQRSAHQQVREVRCYGRGLWALFALFAIAVIVVAALSPLTMEKVREYGPGTTRPLDVWEYFGLLRVTVGHSSATSDRVAALIQSAVQGVLTAGLHCADIAVSFLNDEERWQDAFDAFESSPSKTTVENNERLLKWRSVLLFAVKAAAQWVFGSITGVDIWFCVVLIPLATLSVMVLLIAVTVEFMIRKTPNRRGQTTYGDLRLLMRLMKNLENSRQG